MSLLMALSLMACFDSEPAVSEPATPPAPEAPAPDAPATQAPGPQAPAGELQYADESAHAALSEHILVIVHSGAIDSTPPEAVQALGAGLPLQRLWSSRYKGLMPCYGIVIAGAFTDMSAARARSAELKERGVDHYLKRAGAYVGVDPRLDRMCSDDTTSTCVSDLAIAVDIGGTPHLALHLEPEVAERAVANAADPEMMDGDGTQWSTPLAVKQVGAARKGDRWKLWSAESGEAVTCEVAGLHAVTRGTPHFGWAQAEPRPTSPGCGSPEPMAELRCEGTPGAGPWLARPETAAEIVAYEKTTDLSQALSNAHLTVAHNAAGSDIDEAESWGREQGAPHNVSTYQDHWVSDAGGDVVTVALSLMTGEGFAMCGGPDFDRDLLTIYKAQGPGTPPLMDLHDTTDRELLGLFEIDGQLHALERDWFGALYVVGSTGDARCSLDLAYCDCPC